jgi:predicted DCC family thiol-disulfide oxidoreductase YuxK
MTSRRADRRLLVLYDADCGICIRSARVLRRLDHGRRLRLVPLQDAGEFVDAPPFEVLLDALHVRDPDGRWSLAGTAWIRVAEEVPLLRPLAVLARVPAIRWLVEWTYARVAGNRRLLSHLLGDDVCSVPARTLGRAAVQGVGAGTGSSRPTTSQPVGRPTLTPTWRRR